MSHILTELPTKALLGYSRLSCDSRFTAWSYGSGLEMVSDLLRSLGRWQGHDLTQNLPNNLCVLTPTVCYFSFDAYDGPSCPRKYIFIFVYMCVYCVYDHEYGMYVYVYMCGDQKTISGVSPHLQFVWDKVSCSPLFIPVHGLPGIVPSLPSIFAGKLELRIPIVYDHLNSAPHSSVHMLHSLSLCPIHLRG